MNDMRTPVQTGLPVVPDAEDVLEAIRRLEFQGAHAPDDLGPSVEAGVSGRTVSAGGPLLSPSIRELGLLLDDELVDDLMLANGPRVSIPVEMALGALAEAPVQSRTTERAVGDAPPSLEGPLSAPVDPLGSRWRLTSWSGRELARKSGGLSATLAPSIPSFLKEIPLRRRSSKAAASRFRWDLLADRRLRARRSLPGAAGNGAAATAKASADGASSVDPLEDTSLPAGSQPAPPPGAAAWWTSAGADHGHDRSTTAVREQARASGTSVAQELLDDAERALARARRAPSPISVALASLVLPGWGQALNEERGKAVLFRVAYLATLFLAATLAWRG